MTKCALTPLMTLMTPVGLPICTPSRACLETGRMPFAVRSTSADHDWMEVNEITMHTNEITIAEQLNELGYS